ncbi:MAG: flagellar hook-basal body protein [Planctomycetes bacterium]|nr:flagellar hook-basal body protein [Planctomycetota bacterium]
MIYGLYLSAAGALAESARHDVISNNIANVSTPGFKADMAVFQAREAEAVEDSRTPYATPMDRIGGGLSVSSTYTRHRQGPIEMTGNEFDLAISGEGFFAVTDGNQVNYTRAGAFSCDSRGRLVMPDGRHFLADASGKPIMVPLEGDIAVAQDGTLSCNGEPAGRIRLFEFSNKGALEKVGANLYANHGAPGRAGSGRIKQGAVEGSNASPAEEISRMLIATRSYDANMQMIRMQDQTLSDLVTVGRVAI